VLNRFNVLNDPVNWIDPFGLYLQGAGQYLQGAKQFIYHHYDKIYAATAFLVNEYQTGAPGYIHLAGEFVKDPNRAMWAFYDVVDPLADAFKEHLKREREREWEEFKREHGRLKRRNKPNSCP